MFDFLATLRYTPLNHTNISSEHALSRAEIYHIKNKILYMLVIRLSRVGKKKQPEYRLIVSEKTKDPWGKVKEILGFIRPRTNPKTINIKKDRVAYWLSKGAQASPTVRNMLIDEGLIKGAKHKTIKISRKRAVKIAEKKKKEKSVEVLKSELAQS